METPSGNRAEMYVRWGGEESILHYALEQNQEEGSDRGLSQEENSFLISPFSGKMEKWSIHLKSSVSSLPEIVLTENQLKFSAHKSREEYIQLVETMVGEMTSPNPENALDKVVTARTHFVACNPNVPKWFDLLSKAYPQAHVYFMNHPKWGQWMGATPELLLAQEGSLLKTMSLAGTRLAGTKDSWGEKEKQEQAYVTDFIKSTLEDCELSSIEVGEVFTKNAGPIEHLCTRLSAEAKSPKDFIKTAKALHPTPAVCGIPREGAKVALSNHEGLNRQLYAGFFGENSKDRQQVAVNLRCLTFVPNGVVLWAGGGLTADSIPEDEWTETENKMMTLRGVLSI
jgi:isochorismate synthase